MTQRSDLTTDIVAWTGHNFGASQLSSIIRLAEANINRDVRIRAMYQADDAFAINAASETVPTGLLEVKRFRLSGNNQTLDYLPPNAFYENPLYERPSGTPEIYTIEGANFIFAPAPTDSFTGQLGYIKRFDALAADADTNTLLDEHYDIYLHASLAIAFSFAQDDEQATKYLSLYNAAIESLNEKDQFSSHQMSSLKRRVSHAI